MSMLSGPTCELLSKTACVLPAKHNPSNALASSLEGLLLGLLRLSQVHTVRWSTSIRLRSRLLQQTAPGAVVTVRIELLANEEQLETATVERADAPTRPHVGAVEQDMQPGGGLQTIGKLKCCRDRHLFVTNNGLSGTTTVALPLEQQGRILQAKVRLDVAESLCCSHVSGWSA